MTRGKFIIITNKKVINSCEFNGDMYGSPLDSERNQKVGHYRKAINILKEITNAQDFEEKIKIFDSIVGFNYQDKYDDFNFKEQLLKKCKNESDEIEMTDDNYFEKYFSDYLYIKNCGAEVIKIRDRDKQLIKLLPEQIGTFNFGRVIEII